MFDFGKAPKIACQVSAAHVSLRQLELNVERENSVGWNHMSWLWCTSKISVKPTTLSMNHFDWLFLNNCVIHLDLNCFGHLVQQRRAEQSLRCRSCTLWDTGTDVWNKLHRINELFDRQYLWKPVSFSQINDKWGFRLLKRGKRVYSGLALQENDENV